MTKKGRFARMGQWEKRLLGAGVYAVASVATLFYPDKTAEAMRGLLGGSVSKPMPRAASDEFYLDAPQWLDAPHCSQFIITAHHRERGYMIGRVVCDVCPSTDSCYVADVVVFEETLRGKGVGLELLRAALELSGATKLAPVTITKDAVGFWCHLAQTDRLPVRLGLQLKEVDVIRRTLLPHLNAQLRKAR